MQVDPPGEVHLAPESPGRVLSDQVKVIVPIEGTLGMSRMLRTHPPEALESGRHEVETLSDIIKEQAKSTPTLSILEAGCGTRWGLNLKGISYILTGVDIDEDALDIRVNQKKDLDLAIEGDLKTVELEENHYDVIFNSNVLEHVDGAEKVLDNLVRWLKPGGIILLLIPNRDSAKGFLTRISPFRLHVLFYKYIKGYKTAGKPGHAPFRTHFDKVVSRTGIHEYCGTHKLAIKKEFSAGHGRELKLIYHLAYLPTTWIVHLASLGRLSLHDHDLIFVIEKPRPSGE